MARYPRTGSRRNRTLLPLPRRNPRGRGPPTTTVLVQQSALGLSHRLVGRLIRGVQACRPDEPDVGLVEAVDRARNVRDVDAIAVHSGRAVDALGIGADPRRASK